MMDPSTGKDHSNVGDGMITASSSSVGVDFCNWNWDGNKNQDGCVTSSSSPPSSLSRHDAFITRGGSAVSTNGSATAASSSTDFCSNWSRVGESTTPTEMMRASSFHRRRSEGTAPAAITEWARQHLKNLWSVGNKRRRGKTSSTGNTTAEGCNETLVDANSEVINAATKSVVPFASNTRQVMMGLLMR